MRNRSWPAMPYPGLRPFDISADRDESVIFFGRKKQIYELIDRLATSHFIAVLGPSGCGKSSLIRAGVIPDLALGYLHRAGARWTSIVMEPGGHPVRALANSLQNALVAVVPDGKIPDQFTSEEIEQCLKHRPDALVTFFEDPEIAAVFGPDRNVLILVDQFEELFRPDMTSEQDAQHFINLMLNVYHDPPQRLYIILTMRTDFIKQSACYPGLPTVLSRTMCLLDKIDKMGLREAITEPVKLKPYNGEISDDLTKWILGQMDTEGPYDPDLLPLMQHALLWGWQQTLHKTHPATEDKAQSEIKEKTVLKKEDFSAFTGLADCLSKHADAIFNGLTSEQQQIAEVMFRLLCDVTPDGSKIRRVTSVEEIDAVAECRNNKEDLNTVIKAFMSNGAGFIRWKDEGKMLDVSHESFIRKWDRFNAWADLEAKKAKRYIKLLSRTHDSQETGLLNRLELDYYSKWFKETKPKPTAAWAKRYRNLPNIKKDDNSRESQTIFETDYLDVLAYLKDSEDALSRKFYVTLIAVGFISILLLVAVLFWASMNSLTAENYLKIAKETLTQSRAIDESQYKLNLSEMINNADKSLTIDNELPIRYLPEYAKRWMRMEDRPAQCHLVKAKAYLLMAKLERSLVNYEKGILELFYKVTAKEPKNSDAYQLLVDMIEIHLERVTPDSVNSANELSNIFRKNNADSNKNYVLIGNIYKSKELFDKARDMYKYAYDNSNKDIGTVISLGDIYFILKDFDQAKHYYEEALKIDANNAKIREKLSQIHISIGDHDTAIKYLEKIVAEEVENREACINLVNEYLFVATDSSVTARTKSEKIDCLNKINKDLQCLTPNEYIRKAKILMGMQDQVALDLAYKSFEDAIIMQETAGIENPEPYFMLASAYAQKEDYFKAIKHYSNSVSKDKYDFRALRGLAFCLEKIGKYSEAAEKLKESEKFEPWKPLVADTSEQNIKTSR